MILFIVSTSLIVIMNNIYVIYVNGYMQILSLANRANISVYTNIITNLKHKKENTLIR